MPSPPSSAHDEGQSPFHAGEQQLQERLGVRWKTEVMGRSVMHDFLPDKQRRFFEQLPFVLIGSVDDEGWPWASVLFGPPGFVATPDERTLAIAANPAAGDPLGENLAVGAAVSLLGIELPTRRRNRVNATVQSRSQHGFKVRVDQFYGNCPKYIQAREPRFARPPQDVLLSTTREALDELGDAERSLIQRADTLFVASYAPSQSPAGFLGDTGGVDINHRGGRPGFVKLEGQTLTVPDYQGNNLFNTLGNFQLNPRAGVLFLDFETGDLLQLVGETEMFWDDHDEVQQFEGAYRAWRLHFNRGHWLRRASPLSWGPEEPAPSTLKTGVWRESQ